jgi:hypothetical protein
VSHIVRDFDLFSTQSGPVTIPIYCGSCLSNSCNCSSCAA